MQYKLIIFDFDGTLADTLPWIFTVADGIAEKYHLPRLDQVDLNMVRRLDAKTLIKRHKVSAWKIILITRHLHRLMAKNIHRLPLFEGVDDMLGQLSEAGITLAVVSSNARENVRRVLGPANVARIRHFECGVSVFGKAAKFKRVLKRAGVRPSEALVVGDELRDVDAARRLHIPFGAVAWGYTHLDALETRMPREVFHTVGDITRLLLSGPG